jgi:hypothetical protein
MKIRQVAATLAITILTFGIVAAEVKVNFSGTWTLDKNRSEGLPPGMDQTMKITQAGDKIDVEVKVNSQQGEQTINDSYIINGKEQDFTPPLIGGGAGKGKRTSRQSADSKGIEVIEIATIQSPNGPEEIKVSRRWQMSEDGNTLTIEMTVDRPDEVVKSKRVFVKK